MVKPVVERTVETDAALVVFCYVVSAYDTVVGGAEEDARMVIFLTLRVDALFL